MTDDHFMSIALRLAEKNLGNVAPNPAVGCVIVKDGTIVSEGYTGIGGRPHAEVVALQNAKDSTHGATIYITLEPCCHHGVTGPCTAKIIKASIKRVVIATIDPDSRVSGRGMKALKEAGIKVEQGIMQKEAKELNVGFFTTKELHRPFIACKVATTLDGKIATFTGDSKWITSENTRNWVHELRTKYDAIMIGSNTLINDDPLLTCRLPGLGSRSPIRLIIDSQGRLKEEHNIAKTADKVITWVITNKEVEKKIKNINYLVVNSSNAGKVCLKDMALKLVSEIGITRLLVEGGGVLITELLKCNLIDRLIICR
ncbi:MAG: bifunctional diaminohydroxyphosphoribosylaminopyrimidine deaminase/5-amino-6-(5-phosphoribosylamino)uracil reductase RibD, partial [Wolbachia endosymbiont of Andrena apicata]|nr:bifunctional diaminohydroxyphosphoribosylaminopyrimidine deaminase/5-amino-6-(5-phosphoribosylamino)uracil reductase RibD [Wolbachia endosymbiont of Andrena apicata]